MPVKGILKKSGRRIDRKKGQVNETNPQAENNRKAKFASVSKDGFTKEELTKIVNKHKELVEEMNKRLPEGKKLTVDPDLEKKLQDPKLAKMYHISQEIKAKAEEQNKIYENVVKKYGRPEKNVANFSIANSFRTGKTEEDRIYNEQLYRNYKDNPQKFVHGQYQKILNTSGKELYDLGNDPLKQGEYYLNNYEKCRNSANMETVVNNKDNKDVFTTEFKNNIKSVASLAYNLNRTKYALDDYNSIDKLAFPSINEEQANILYDSDFCYQANSSEDVQNCVKNIKFNREKEPSPKEIFEKIDKKTGVDLALADKFATKVIFLDKEGKGMSVEKVLEDQNKKVFGGTNDIAGTNEEREMDFITNGFKNLYMEKWQKKYCEKAGVDKLDIKAIEDSHKGSFFNRLFRRPSKEYKEMMKAFKEYNNPESKNYMNKDLLNDKTQAYIEHKNEKGKELTGADKIRMDFAKSVINTNKESDKIFAQTQNVYNDRVAKRVTFLLPEEVEEKAPNKEKEKEIVNVKEVAKEENEKVQDNENLAM